MLYAVVGGPAAAVSWQTNWPELAGDSRLQAALTAFGFLLFLVGNLNHTLWYLTPDMLVEGLAYLGAACALRVYEPGAGVRHSAVLGIVLGLGYLGKAAMLPMSLLLIAIVFRNFAQLDEAARIRRPGRALC